MKPVSKRRIRLTIAALCIVMLGVSMAACSHSKNSEPSASNTSGQVEAGKDSKKTITSEIDWQMLAQDYNPPAIDGLLREIKKSDIGEDGSIIITPGIKQEFSHMGQAYHFFFMPNVAWYDFESTGAAISYMLFTWTGEFGTFPEKAPQYQAEARLHKIFAAPNDHYPRLEHQTYTKFVEFDGQAYTPWPESYNDSTMIYDLTNLKVRQDGNYTYYTATAGEYQFDVNGNYEPGENEKFLSAKAQALGLAYTETLDRLLTNGEITGALKRLTYTIEFRIEGDSNVPMIVSVDKKF